MSVFTDFFGVVGDPTRAERPDIGQLKIEENRDLTFAEAVDVGRFAEEAADGSCAESAVHCEDTAIHHAVVVQVFTFDGQPAALVEHPRERRGGTLSSV